MCGMSMWMRMPGQSWPGAEASFLVMWMAMMTAMMLPSLLPVLFGHRWTRAARIAAGYFAVWGLIGAAIFPIGAAFASTGVQWPAAAAGIVVLAAGALQFTGWKARHLARCRLPAPEGSAWRHGLRLGLHCGCGCAGFTAALLAVGVMDPWAMAASTAAITAERLFPAGGRTARLIGAGAVIVGLVLVLTL